MDRFITKQPGSQGKRKLGLLQVELGADKDCTSTDDLSGGPSASKKCRNDGAVDTKFKWKKIESYGLDCDYGQLFIKPEADDIFQQLEKEVEYLSGDLTKIKVHGKWHDIPRKQAAYGDPNLTYTYSGVTLSPKPWIPVLEFIRSRLTEATGYTFNFVLVNRYNDGRDHMGEHRDDEKEMEETSPIASVSFGACRDFFFRHMASRGKSATCRIEPIKVQLEHGSLLMMNYPTNVYWYHSLPVRKTVKTSRINLTFRRVIPVKEKPEKK